MIAVVLMHTTTGSNYLHSYSIIIIIIKKNGLIISIYHVEIPSQWRYLC